MSLMVEQIEFANVVVLNKQSEVSEKERSLAEGIIGSLNPTAHVIKTDFSQLPLSSVLCTGLFDFETAEDMPGWAKLQATGWVPKVASCAVRHMLYKRDRPFHPNRLGQLIFSREYAALQSDDEGLTIPHRLGMVRSKGTFWIATRSEMVGDWQHAGDLYRFLEGQPWDPEGKNKGGDPAAPEGGGELPRVIIPRGHHAEVPQPRGFNITREMISIIIIPISTKLTQTTNALFPIYTYAKSTRVIEFDSRSL